MAIPVTASGVVVDKPWYLSKKIWLCVIALMIALLQTATGRWASLNATAVAERVAEAATYLAPLLATILAFAHVDAHTRGAALIAEALQAAESLDERDDRAAPPTPENPS